MSPRVKKPVVADPRLPLRAGVIRWERSVWIPRPICDHCGLTSPAHADFLAFEGFRFRKKLPRYNQVYCKDLEPCLLRGACK